MLLDLPSAREEAWRWSDLSALPALAGTAPDIAHGDREHWDHKWIDCALDGPRLFFVDGVLDKSRSNTGPIRIGDVAGKADGHPLASQIGPTGWTLRLGRDHAPPGLVQIVHLTTGGADHLPAEIVIEAGAQASIVETYVGAGWTNRLTHISLAKAARLMLSRRMLGDRGPSASLRTGFVSLTDRAEVGEGASLTLTTLAAGGNDSRIDSHVRMTGEAAFVEAGGALLARGRQRHDANLVLRHDALAGTSRQVWRGVADDKATVSVAARVEVARAAQKTDGEQSLRGLLLARTATINLKPELEIFADDVKCAHGATVGELDRNALFYLASRGVPEVEAKGLLTQAFVADAIDRIGEQAVREAFHADVAKWFGEPK